MPLMTLDFNVCKDRKTISFYLPLSINKFVRFVPAHKSEIDRELIDNMGIVKKTEEFKVNPNVFRLKQI